MLDLDKLSYRSYGNVVMIVLLLVAIILNIFPFSFIGLVTCVSQVPWYLYVRWVFQEPIHANGLNKCFGATIFFFIILFVCSKAMIAMIDTRIAVLITFFLTTLGCFITSTLPNTKESEGKLFFGYKKHNESKYEKLIEYIKFNGIDPKLIEAEKRLSELDTQMYLFYKRKFREDKTFQEMVDEFDIDNPRIVEILDKVYFYMIGALKI